jgi:hypothetical protein
VRAGHPSLGLPLRSLLCTAALCLLFVASLPLARGASPTIAVSEITPGMKGHGLTVFRGQQPERFDVEVIDVLRNFRPDQDLILIRTRHPILDQALAVGGMSGSPIFLDGRLAGAYAYGWMFGKEPIAGVTPIASMLAEMARPVDPEVWKALGTLPRAALGAPRPKGKLGARAASDGLAPARDARVRLSGLPPQLGLQRTDALASLRAHARAHGLSAGGGSASSRADHPTLAAASTPLLLSGLDERVVSMLADELEPFGLITLQAGGGAAPKAAASTAPAQFVDGGAIGVQLIRGDINATAIGTVTHVAGKRVAAFGHPMMNAGQPALPTCTARVLHILASSQRSFKIAEAHTPLGTLIHDRQAAIVIDTSLRADTVPMKIRLHGVPNAPRTEWNVELASQRLLTPMLAMSALMNAVTVSAGDRTDVMVETTSNLWVVGRDKLTVEDRGWAPVGAVGALSQLRLFDLVDVAYGNPFEDARIERIEVDVRMRFGRELVEIVGARVHATEVDPGRDLNVYLTLRRYGRPEETKLVTVPIPARAAGQKVELSFDAGPAVEIERPVPESLDQIFDNVRLGYPGTSMVVSTRLPTQGLRMRGHLVRDLPGSAYDTLQLAADAGRGAPFSTVHRAELPLGEVVYGNAKLSLDVRSEPLR